MNPGRFCRQTYPRESDATTGEEAERAIPFMKGRTVFNVEQIEDLPEPFYANPEPKAEREQGDAQSEITSEDVETGGRSKMSEILGPTENWNYRRLWMPGPILLQATHHRVR
jgi:hypothetical protein